MPFGSQGCLLCSPHFKYESPGCLLIAVPYFCSMEEINSPWKTLSSQHIYENPWISVHEDKVINPRGGEGIYGRVCFKNKAIGIIPVDEDGNTWLVGQYRYALNEYSWEIPMGGDGWKLILWNLQKEN